MAGHNEFVNETSFYNIMVLSHLLPASMWEPLPHFLQTWLRNYVAVTLLYFISGFLWCFYIYYLKLNVYVHKGQLTDPFVIPYWPGEGGKLSPTSYLSGSLTPRVILYSIPTKKAMLVQIYVAMKAIPMYTLLPAITEYMIERGWTQCYSTADQVNWFLCVLYIVLYLAFLEFAAYWVHKEFHENKFLYKHFHAVHHIYNKNDSISPFAGFAFHPMEGILQALPQVIALFVVPIHLRTLIVLLLLDGIFTTNIHDCIHGNVWPIMGAGYHTLHHTTYKHNYGHYTIWMDLMFGSLKTPVAEENSVKEKAK